jgi:heme-degrading monooxygenase HmoA
MDAAEPFAALVIYPTTPPVQAGEADALVQAAESTMRNMPGYVRGSVFLSEDGTSVISLVEWRDRESFMHFRQSEVGRAAAQAAGELHPKAYWLRPLATVTAP